MQFQRATRRKTWLKIALTGASGAGKTYSALKLAFGLGQRIAVIDTENSSAALYAHLGEYDTLDLAPPFTTERYEEAIRAGVEAGYDVLILDSISHAWAGTGGLLAQKEMLDARGTGNSFQNWAPITRKHEAFKAAMLEAPAHIICTMRSKEDHVLTTDERGKPTVRKAGMAPIQREGMGYEFTIVFDINAADHTALASKDRTDLFAGFHGLLTTAEGQKIARWLESGAEPLVAPAPPAPTPAANGAAKARQTPPQRAEAPARKPPPDPARLALKARWDATSAEAAELGLDVSNFAPTAGLEIEEIEALVDAVEQTVRDERAKRQEVAA